VEFTPQQRPLIHFFFFLKKKQPKKFMGVIISKYKETTISKNYKKEFI